MKISKEKFKIAMARAKVSRDELAVRSGLNPVSITNLLWRGTCKPATAGKLAEALEVDVTEILEE